MGLKPNGNTYEIHSDNGEPLPYKIDQSFDMESISDNYYINYFKSVESVFFWLSGRWDQLDQWIDFWPVDVYSILGSILLVIILQNMLIATMT